MKTIKLLAILVSVLLSACGGDGSSTSPLPSDPLQIKSVSFELLPTTYNGTLVYSNGYQITLEYSGAINTDASTTSTASPFTLTLGNYSSGNLVKKTFPSYNGLASNKTIRFRTYDNIGSVTGRSFYLTLTDKQGNDSNTFIYTGAIPPIVNPLTTTPETTSPPTIFSNMSTLSIVPVAGAADFIPSMTYCTPAMNKAYSLYGTPDSISTNESMYAAYTYYNVYWRYGSQYNFNFSWQSNGYDPSCQFSSNPSYSSSSTATPIPIATVLLKRANP